MARDKQPFKQYTAHSKNELQSQLLASTEYNKWIANKRPRNSSALFSVATACGVTLVCILAVYIRLGSSVVQPASVDEVLQLLRQTQNENNQLAEQQQAMEDQLTFARYQIEALKSQLSTSQPSQKQTEQVQTTTSTRDTPLHVLQQLYTNRTGSRDGVAAYFSLPLTDEQTIVIGLISALALSFLGHIWSWSSAKAIKAHLDDLAENFQEAIFAKENAEQSLELLEGELQRKLTQLADAQQKPLLSNAPAGSPKTTPYRSGSPGTPLIAAHTPGKTDLPPPPSVLVERFLEERRAVAVEEDQIIAWLEMEENYKTLQQQLSELELSKELQRVADINDMTDNGTLSVDMENVNKSDTPSWKVVTSKSSNRKRL